MALGSIFAPGSMLSSVPLRSAPLTNSYDTCMATSECEEELIPLQRLGDEQSGDNSLDLQSEPRRQDDGKGVGEGTARQVSTSRWKGVSITVTTMLSYAALNAAISMISPFYPIVVSFQNM